MPWDFALILLVLAVLVPWRGAVRMKQLLARPRLATADRLALYASTIAFQWMAVGLTAWRCYARGLSAQRLGLDFRQPQLATAATVTLALLFAASQLLSLRRMARLPPHRRGFVHRMVQNVMPQNLVERLAFVALVITVALCEEFLYRGFAFAVIQEKIARSVIAGSLGSSALFALAHIYQGRRGLLTTFAVGLVFSGARALTGSLAPSIVSHLVADLLAGLAAPRLLCRTAAQPIPSGRPLPSEQPHGRHGDQY